MRVHGVTGRKNSGKTGLMERLVAEIVGRGFRVSTVKHAHHVTDVDQPGRDSHRHRMAGATEVLLATPLRWALMHELRGAPEPAPAEVFARFSPVDLLLVEGFKHGDHPKIECLRRETGTEPLAREIAGVRAFASDYGDPGLGLPVFHLDDTQAIADFILREVGLLPRPSPGAGKPFEPDASVAEALARMRAAIRPIAGEVEIPLAEASGRVLARAMAARRSHPPTDNSAVDGYGFAFDAVDMARPIPLEPGRSAAGAPFAGVLPPGRALRILTGALPPEGMDAVVPEESTRIEEGRLILERPPGRRGANIRPAGEDMKEGAEALAAGAVLRPGDLALAAAVGLGRLPVRPKLRVAIFSTGDELADPGELAEGRTYDANRPMLRALLERQGYEVLDLGVIPDARPTIRAALEEASARADAVLTTGGASRGDEDHVSALLREEGELQVWRVAIKPGRPLALAHWRSVPVFGLPGNPVAAMICALIFALPGLALRAGAAWREPEAYQVVADFARRKQFGRREYLRARINAQGRAEAFPSEGSGRVSGLSWAGGLVELPEDLREIRPGDLVRYLPFSGFGL
ncbi:gephyrin-like molybdotransferase Glp [Neomegalonema sp.]|uniref:molybdopterin-guanine dinucleotide biosynthesis protein B n=1 Tax=Neomegalonema sp. TaxID=2039713 RepID=UPI0026084532|nr:gephyrin-like molybdotransferase Glp [Neomegalonema sp.]MDD2868468.1 molybdopterin-guanine dinucleotide biosynthesis protein B [Neomegalonema sp.]